METQTNFEKLYADYLSDDTVKDLIQQINTIYATKMVPVRQANIITAPKLFLGAEGRAMLDQVMIALSTHMQTKYPGLQEWLVKKLFTK